MNERLQKKKDVTHSCDLCNKTFKSQNSYDQHILSKKHRKLQQAHDKKRGKRKSHKQLAKERRDAVLAAAAASAPGDDVFDVMDAIGEQEDQESKSNNGDPTGETDQLLEQGDDDDDAWLADAVANINAVEAEQNQQNTQEDAPETTKSALQPEQDQNSSPKAGATQEVSLSEANNGGNDAGSDEDRDRRDSASNSDSDSNSDSNSDSDSDSSSIDLANFVSGSGRGNFQSALDAGLAHSESESEDEEKEAAAGAGVAAQHPSNTEDNGEGTSEQTAQNIEPEEHGWEHLLRKFYTAHNPDKLASVPMVLQKYDGREEVLFAMLDKRYGTVTDVSDEVAWALHQKQLGVSSAPQVADDRPSAEPSAPAASAAAAETESLKGLSKREKRRRRLQRQALQAAQKATVVRPDEDGDDVDLEYEVIDTGAAAGDDAAPAEETFRCKTCGRHFRSHNEVFRHLRTNCKPAPKETPYVPGQTLNPDAAKVVYRKGKKKKKK